ncbi:MAG: NAD(P)-binding protein [Pseudomonadales bacterium]|nr:NAD(P)-binding protein [Pseudomonadales bacterium]
MVIGAGHAGLAMSYQLQQAGIEHVVLDAGDIGQRWRSERWDSLRLLTPNWMLDLPGFRYAGQDPDGYMHKDSVADHLVSYASFMSAPLKRYSRVHRLWNEGEVYRVQTTQGLWQARAVVMATGAFAKPLQSPLEQSLPDGVVQLTTNLYKRPTDVPTQRIMVVGGSATGLQFAQELNQAGHEVTLSVGEHVRMPRRVAGHDIYHWLTKSGVFWEQAGEVDDLRRARRLPSPQLIGQQQDLNLNELSAAGVDIVGRFVGVSDGKAQFSGNLPNLCKSADLKLFRLLQRFKTSGLAFDEAELNFAPTEIPKPRLSMRFGASGVGTILWATGYRPDYSWVDMDVCDNKGLLQHQEGVVRPGLYALGLPLMRSRASTFIAGVRDDTSAIACHVAAHLDSRKQLLATAF